MKAIGFNTFGGPEVLHVVELREPEPGPGEIAITVRAVNVNPTDLVLRAGGRAAQLQRFPPPWIPGVDVAGIVHAVGPGVDGRLAPGDEVIAVVVPMTARGGTYAERIVVDERSVIAAPRNATAAQASTLLLNGLTAQLALNTAALPNGSIIAVTGAAGAVGGYAVQLASAAGLRVIAVAGAEDRELVRSFGAAEVFTRDDYLPEAIDLVLPRGVAAVIDAAILGARAAALVADTGMIITLRGWAGPAERGITVHAVSAFDAFTDTAALETLRGHAENGTVQLRVAEVLPAERAADAHRRLEKGRLRGRLVLDFDQLL